MGICRISALNYSRRGGPPFLNAPLINKVLNPRAGFITRAFQDVGGLFLPRRCGGCDQGLRHFEQALCLFCLNDLPRTRFHDDPRNRVEELFRGKVMVEAASALLHFNPTGMVQRILHRIKYQHDQGLGLELGRLMAEDVKSSARFSSVDLLLPVPLHPRKQHQRGYNQSQLLVDGMRTAWPVECVGEGLVRVVRTPSQTRRNRLDRWLNVKEAFVLPDPEELRDRHVLIVDDVVTTGATLEGCIRALAVVPGIRISVLTAACA